jgi:hypothetical protein
MRKPRLGWEQSSFIFQQELERAVRGFTWSFMPRLYGPYDRMINRLNRLPCFPMEKYDKHSGDTEGVPQTPPLASEVVEVIFWRRRLGS